jgi:cytochrome b6-f complex iron-sulfur subunit
LTLKEKLAAARAGGAVGGEAPAPASTGVPEETAAVEQAAPAAPRVPPPTPASLGRPLTLQEKLAAARAGGSTGAAPAAGAKPAAAKPAAAKAAAPPARELPPLEEITDPRDLAEALRRKGAEKAKEAAAKAAPPPKPAAKPAPPKPNTVLPRPSREEAGARPHISFSAEVNRRGFMISSFFVSWIAAAWVTFTATATAWTLMSVRFLFPNVLAEPPTTIKIGLPSKYDPEAVNESYKAEWGFWVVRSTRYNGQEIIYALQSICTHLGCPPNWLANEQKFKCPCHGSGFYVTGINFEGPAPRPLERFKVALADDGQIVVDKSQKFQEELGQWSDPDSFVPV